MPVFKLGKYFKINPLNKSVFQKRRETLVSNSKQTGELDLSTTASHSLRNQGDVVMVVPSAINPVEEIKYGLLFIVVAAILLALFSIFAYFGIRNYQRMLATKSEDFLDLEVNIAQSKKAEKQNGVGQFDINLNPFNNNPLDFLNNKKKILDNYSLIYQSKCEPKKIGFPEKPSRSYLSETPFNNHHDMTSYSDMKNINYQQKSNEQYLESKKLDGRNKDSLLENLKNETNSLSAFINCETPTVLLMAKKKKGYWFKKDNRIKYTKRELVDLEPVQTYQLLEYCYNDGDLLVTDLIFPVISLPNCSNVKASSITLTDIRHAMIDKITPASIKTLELIRFVSISAGMKNYDNPIVFTLPYGLLIDTMVNFDLVNSISSTLPTLLKSAYVETVIMYCISCWKFEKIKNDSIESFFKNSKEELYIPPKLKVYEFIIILMSQGFRNNLLEEVLIFFSLAPSPHMLPNVINQSKFEKTNKLNRLFKYLLRQLQQEHYLCCANTAKWKHWELTTSGYENSIGRSCSPIEDDKIIADPYPLRENDLKGLQENIQSFEQRKLNYTSRDDFLSISDENDSNKTGEKTYENDSKFPLLTRIPKFIFDATNILPGSLSPSPTQKSPHHF
ncbi:hypothetical protein CANINC_002694 [Pichia inconspicua]|uniref:Uncharacterized protein n=1 Tax=Pichia inconspicua TaxID=52247 RepID=A0A4T0X261_9ASCO|nr:hypothetical protein CANINC_002694 [[Candida] inconspicua]